MGGISCFFLRRRRLAGSRAGLGWKRREHDLKLPVDAHPCSIFRTAHCVHYQRQPTSFPARNLIAYMNQEAPWGCSACEGLALPT